MTLFPRLSTGAIAQYPSSVRAETSTRILKYIDGSEQRFRETAGTARFWTLRLDQVTELEMSAMEEFFVAQQGRFGQFTFVDPFDGTEYPNCSFDADSIRSQIFGEDWAGTTLTIRSS